MSQKRARQERLVERDIRQRRERLVFDGAAKRGFVIPEAIWNARVRDRGGFTDTRPQPVRVTNSYASDDLVTRKRRQLESAKT